MSERITNTGKPDPSIAEETVEHYKQVTDSLAGLIEKSDISLRDFVLLSFSCDQGPMEVGQLASVLTLDRKSTLESIARLERKGLVQQRTSIANDSVVLISTTIAGVNFVRKIDCGDDD